VRDLPERALDAEVREVEVFLVDDRRDPRIDLDDVVADELDVEEVLDAELGDDPLRDFEQPVVVQGLEVHGQPGAHRLARLRVAEDDLSRACDSVDRALPAGCELHHEQIGPALLGQELDHVFQPHRQVARTFLEQLLRAVDAPVEDAEPA